MKKTIDLSNLTKNDVIAVAVSGGKDSTMALYYALKEKEDVKYLLSMKSQNDESYMFHVPNINLTELLAEAMNIPLISVNTDVNNIGINKTALSNC